MEAESGIRPCLLSTYQRPPCAVAPRPFETRLRKSWVWSMFLNQIRYFQILEKNRDKFQQYLQSVDLYLMVAIAYLFA